MRHIRTRLKYNRTKLYEYIIGYIILYVSDALVVCSCCKRLPGAIFYMSDELVVCSCWKPLPGAIFTNIAYLITVMVAIAFQITSLTIVYSTVYSDADQRKLQSSASLAFVRGIHRGPVNSPHKWPATRKMFPFDDVIMLRIYLNHHHT